MGSSRSASRKRATASLLSPLASAAKPAVAWAWSADGSSASASCADCAREVVPSEERVRGRQDRGRVGALGIELLRGLRGLERLLVAILREQRLGVDDVVRRPGRREPDRLARGALGRLVVLAREGGERDQRVAVGLVGCERDRGAGGVERLVVAAEVEERPREQLVGLGVVRAGRDRRPQLALGLGRPAELEVALGAVPRVLRRRAQRFCSR